MSVTRGDIFYSDTFPGIGHGKFFVVMGENAEEFFGAFFINSHVHASMFRNPMLLNLQVGLGPDEYPFLVHNSYLNCAQIIRIPKAVFHADLDSGRASSRGRLSDEDLETVLGLVRSSPSSPRKRKVTFLNSPSP